MEEPHNIGSNMKFVPFSNKQINTSAHTCANLSISKWHGSWYGNISVSLSFRVKVCFLGKCVLTKIFGKWRF